MSSDEQRKGLNGDQHDSPDAARATPRTSTSQKTPNLYEEFKRRLYQRLGLSGLVVLLVLGGVVGAWWNWNTVRTLPGIEPILVWLARGGLPEADPRRFTVALAHLENDEARQSEDLIFEALHEQFDSPEKNAVQILRFDRTIQRGGVDLEASVNAAHKEARAYLDQSGADVLIWGAVLKEGDERVPKLFWTTRSDLERVRDWGRYPMRALEPPEVFFADLAEILGLLVVTGDSEFRSLEGHFVADRIGPFIKWVRTLLSSSGKGWSKESRVRVGIVLADSLLTLGRQAGTDDALLEAIVLYRGMLQERTRARVPLDWATTQNRLGNALWSLGERESGTARLEKAIAAYREALEERTRERVPLDWAATQTNLGSVLAILGERESGTARLEEAIAAFREALKELTRERVPLDWAATQANLGGALTSLGERESGTARLEEAIAAFREALKEWTRERVPLDWAGIQTNLGSALASLGERESGTARLEKAIAAYREALEELTRERVPLDWARTQNNLGSVLASLGERESGTARLEKAIAAFREALKELTRERVPLRWAATQTNLGNALWMLGERESGTARLEKAIAAHREALKESTRERVPLDWAATQNNLGNALASLGKREEDVTLLCEALRVFLDAWALVAATGASHYTSGLERNIETHLQLLKDRFAAQDYEACLAKHRELLDSFHSSRQ